MSGQAGQGRRLRIGVLTGVALSGALLVATWGLVLHHSGAALLPQVTQEAHRAARLEAEVREVERLPDRPGAFALGDAHAELGQVVRRAMSRAGIQGVLRVRAEDKALGRPLPSYYMPTEFPGIAALPMDLAITRYPRYRDVVELVATVVRSVPVRVDYVLFDDKGTLYFGFSIYAPPEEPLASGGTPLARARRGAGEHHVDKRT